MAFVGFTGARQQYMMVIGTVAEMVAIIKQVREGLMSIKKVMRVLGAKKQRLSRHPEPFST